MVPWHMRERESERPRARAWGLHLWRHGYPAGPSPHAHLYPAGRRSRGRRTRPALAAPSKQVRPLLCTPARSMARAGPCRHSHGHGPPTAHALCRTEASALAAACASPRRRPDADDGPRPSDAGGKGPGKKKITAAASGGPSRLAVWPPVGRYHPDAGGHGLWLVALVCSAATRRRGARRVLRLILALCQRPWRSPAWCPGRRWRLRVGDDTLTRPTQVAEEGGWRVEHPGPMGGEQGCVLGGIRRRALAPHARWLRQAEVAPLALCPGLQAHGAVVEQPLEDRRSNTGLPRAILGDHGSAWQAGVARWCPPHPATCAIHARQQTTALVGQHAWQAAPRGQACPRRAPPPQAAGATHRVGVAGAAHATAPSARSAPGEPTARGPRAPDGSRRPAARAAQRDGAATPGRATGGAPGMPGGASGVAGPAAE